MPSLTVSTAIDTFMQSADAPTALASLGGAPLASPTFTGTPAAPTPTPGDNTTKVATTAALIIANTVGTARNNYSGDVGLAFTLNSAIKVVSLGRWVIAGNSGSHLITLYDKTAGSTIATATVNTSGKTAGQFAYTAITPVNLVIGHSYSLTSAETSGGDQWYDFNTSLSTTAAASNVIPAVGIGGGSGSPGQGYIPTGLEYQ